MKFNIITLGCKVNIYESEYMLEKLQEANYIYDSKNPDIIIINTCSVTNNADAKSLKMIRKYRRENPNSIMVVCGCSAQNNPDKYKDLGINILIGNIGKSKIVNYIDEYLQTKKDYVYFTSNSNIDFENMEISKFTTHTRAFIKIQDGCNNFCSYCIIPYTRGNIRSKNFLEIIKEAQTLVKNGHKEIVLTGIHTGSYSDSDHDLSDLIEELAKIEDLKRIRISSIEVTELNAKFMKVLKETPKICNHLHIPLQSGSNSVLKKMNRKYDKEYYKEKIAEIRKIRPGISLTTDVIVGHPYEGDAEFNECLDFCKKINFSKIHVFPYSMRSGTAASKMPQVPGNIKKERAKILLELSNKLEESYAKSFINTTLDVLTEEYEGNYIVGHTSNYLKVYIQGDYLLNTIYECKIVKYTNNMLLGEVSSCIEDKISI